MRQPVFGGSLAKFDSMSQATSMSHHQLLFHKICLAGVPLTVPRLTCPYKWYVHLSERLYKCKKETSLRVSTSKTFKILNISQKYQVLIADYNPAFK